MDRKFDNFDLIDLMNSKYYKLRKLNEKMWNNSYTISITNSEWSVISLIYGRQPTITEITQQVNITRQATHKCMKALNSKGLITINHVENNHRNKCLKLTSLGEQCFLENKLIKEALERDIAVEIGYDNVRLLKTLLKKI